MISGLLSPLLLLRRVYLSLCESNIFYASKSKFEPIAFPTYGDLARDKLEDDGSEVQINHHRQGHKSYVVLTYASRDILKDKLKEN